MTFNHLILFVPFSSCLQSFPASGSLPMSQLFASGGQRIGVFSFNISPSNEHPGLISFRMDWLDHLAVQRTLKSLVQHQLLELAQTHFHPVGDAIQPSHPLSYPLLLPSIFPSIRVFANELVLPIRWPKYWSFSFSISPSSEYSGLICFGWISLQSKGLSRVFSNTTVQKHQFFGAQLSL